jgi:hypothetical protein
MSIRTLSMLACAGILLASSTAEAGRYYYRSRHSHRPYYGPYAPEPHVGIFIPWGWYIGGGLAATRVLHQQGGEELIGDGAGLSLYTGLRVHPVLALEVGWLGALHDPRSDSFGEEDALILNAFTTDARIYLPSANQAASATPARIVAGGWARIVSGQLLTLQLPGRKGTRRRGCLAA